MKQFTLQEIVDAMASGFYVNYRNGQYIVFVNPETNDWADLLLYNVHTGVTSVYED